MTQNSHSDLPSDAARKHEFKTDDEEEILHMCEWSEDGGFGAMDYFVRLYFHQQVIRSAQQIVEGLRNEIVRLRGYESEWEHILNEIRQERDLQGQKNEELRRLLLEANARLNSSTPLDAKAQPDHVEDVRAMALPHGLVMPERASLDGRFGGHHMRTQDECDAYDAALDEVSRLNADMALKAQPELEVWYYPMPESNGKSNFTALLHRKGDCIMDGVTITLARSEYPDRVRYEADRARYMIGELEDKPCVIDYDADKHSGYVAPAAPAHKSVPECFTRLLHHAHGMTMGVDWNKGTMAGYHRELLCEAVVQCQELLATNNAAPAAPAHQLIVPEGLGRYIEALEKFEADDGVFVRFSDVEGAISEAVIAAAETAAPAKNVSVPDHFVCDSKPLQELLNATAMMLETPNQDAAMYWVEQLESVEKLLASPVQQANSTDGRKAFETWHFSEVNRLANLGKIDSAARINEAKSERYAVWSAALDYVAQAAPEAVGERLQKPQVEMPKAQGVVIQELIAGIQARCLAGMDGAATQAYGALSAIHTMLDEVARLNAAPVQRLVEPDGLSLFKQALFVGMERDCVHYLMANAKGRCDGALKAHNHIQLCSHIVAAVRGCDPDLVRRHHEDDFQAVHEGTQLLTSYLDEAIGFPLNDHPDYDDLTPKFFDRFFELSMAALGISAAPAVPKAESSRVAIDALLAAAVRYERDADSMGPTLSSWPEEQRAKAKECRRAASCLSAASPSPARFVGVDFESWWATHPLGDLVDPSSGADKLTARKVWEYCHSSPKGKE